MYDTGPGGQPSDVAIINKDVGINLSGNFRVPFFFGIVFVNGIEFNSSFSAKQNGVIQFRSGSISPKDDSVSFALKQLDGFNREWYFLTDRRILVLNDGSVKINGNHQRIKNKRKIFHLADLNGLVNRVISMNFNCFYNDRKSSVSLFFTKLRYLSHTRTKFFNLFGKINKGFNYLFVLLKSLFNLIRIELSQ